VSDDIKTQQQDAALAIIGERAFQPIAEAIDANQQPTGWALSEAAREIARAAVFVGTEEEAATWEFALDWYEAAAGSKADAYYYVRERMLNEREYHVAQQARHKAEADRLKADAERLNDRVKAWLLADAEAMGGKPSRKLRDGGSVYCSWRNGSKVETDADALSFEWLKPATVPDQDAIDAAAAEVVASDAFKALAPGEHVVVAPGIVVRRTGGWSAATFKVGK
jgi:hypothetical protein